MKRYIDVVLALLGLIVSAPLLIALVILIYAKLGSPVFFSQVRPGLNGKPFRMLKFRSMTSDCDSEGNLLPDDKRLVPFGVWLRSTSLDELPTLWSVVKGDMSLVGPRPLLMDYLTLYTRRQFRRHEVRPGITGWAQINGRNSLSWEEKFELDIWYVENRSLILDLKIIIRTVMTILRKEGISHKDAPTMPRFTGSKVDG